MIQMYKYRHSHNTYLASEIVELCVVHGDGQTAVAEVDGLAGLFELVVDRGRIGQPPDQLPLLVNLLLLVPKVDVVNEADDLMNTYGNYQYEIIIIVTIKYDFKFKKKKSIWANKQSSKALGYGQETS